MYANNALKTPASFTWVALRMVRFISFAKRNDGDWCKGLYLCSTGLQDAVRARSVLTLAGIFASCGIYTSRVLKAHAERFQDNASLTRRGGHDMGFNELTAEGVAAAVEECIPLIATRLRPDVLNGIEAALEIETDERARSILEMMVENDRIARADHVPLCQDTGSVWVYLEVGEKEAVPGDIFSLVDEAVGRAYANARLRMSLLRDALVDRTNTASNAPAFTELAFRPGSGATLHVMLKGGGSDNASRVVMLPPGAGLDGIREAVLSCVVEKGSAACPPLVIGIGVGATFDKVAGLAKKALLRSVGVPNPDARVAEIERGLLEAVNATGVGPAGLGGDTTALAVNVKTAPCHIAALPLAINMGCSAMRSMSMELGR